EQMEEGHQQADIQTCAETFDAAMLKLENPMANEVNFTLDFAVGGSSFDAEANQKISEAVQFYAENPNYTVTVIGYSNDTTHEAGQSKLAVQRALKVRDALIAQGVPAYQIQAYTGRQQAGIYPAAVAGELGRANIILRLQTQTTM
ncbi:MAG: OmpA family protein, partial [Pseudomonadota bacterium]